jgi:CelD/BcsL family acetyltransferase involved in cellulose biosynthesis
MATPSSAAPATAAGFGGCAALIAAGDPAWRAFVAGHPDALPFHEPAWSEALSAAYGFRGLVMTLADADGELLGGIPLMEVRDPVRGRRWTALPFTDRCPPLIDDGLVPALAGALRTAAADEGIARLEVRAALHGLRAAEVATMQELDLSPGPEALERGFTSATRRNVRKARREGVTVRRAEAEEDLTRTYYGLHLQTRRRLGVPVQPRRFFRAVWEHVLAPGHGHLLLATLDGVDVAGIVLLHAGRTVVYKYGASDVAAWRARPNNVLFAEAIRWSAEAGYVRFDFGRSDFADEGLRAFKRGWGAAELPLVYSSLREGEVAGGDGGGRLLGEVIRRSPPGVCRAIGETLYRYAA